VELLLLDRQGLVELAGGAGGHHVHVVRIDLGADTELRQVAGELGDAGLALAVGGGELADRQEVRDAARNGGLELWQVPLRRMKDTVSGVSGGVFPKAVAPGSAATSVPCCTGTWALGLGLGLGVAARGDAEAPGAMIIIVASAAPVNRLA
jgi:hypothetical protein